MERGRGGRGTEKRQMGVQSLKLMSLVCPGRRQLLSECTVLQGRPAQTPSPPLPFLPKHTSVFDVFQVGFFLLS